MSEGHSYRTGFAPPLLFGDSEAKICATKSSFPLKFLQAVKQIKPDSFPGVLPNHPLHFPGVLPNHPLRFPLPGQVLYPSISISGFTFTLALRALLKPVSLEHRSDIVCH